MEAFTRNWKGNLFGQRGSELRDHCLTLRFAIGQFTGKWEDVVSERNRDILFFELE